MKNLNNIDLTNKYQILNFLNKTGLVKIYDYIKDEKLLKDKDILLSCIENDVRFFQKVPDEFIFDRDFVLKMFLYNPLLMNYVKQHYLPEMKELIELDDIVNICVHLDGINLLHCQNEKLKNDSKYLTLSWERSNIYSRGLLFSDEKYKKKLKDDWKNEDIRLSETWNSFLKKNPNEKFYKYPKRENNYEQIEKILTLPEIAGINIKIYQNKNTMPNTSKSFTKQAMQNMKM